MKTFCMSIALFVILLNNACTNGNNTNNSPAKDPNTNIQLKKIKLPQGFRIDVFATGIKDARSMSVGEHGIVFVGNRQEDKVYAVVDTDGDYKADEKHVIVEGLNMPNGVALKDGDLYVAEVNRILRFNDIYNTYKNQPDYEVIYDEFPTDRHHGWKYIAFGPDDKLYIPVGAPCNICESKNPIYASITRMNPDGSDLEIYAEGIRNTVGFTWHPQTKELWFTDNGRDHMGDNKPPDELNHAPKKGLHFGYPYCHGKDLPDPEFGDKDCNQFTAPVQELGPHVAALGMIFYTGDMFPEKYQNSILIAEHGSWNRSSKIGYRLMFVNMEDGKATSYTPFAKGWLQDESVWGRPVDVEQLPDGSILVSDDYANAIYRISYE